MPDQTTKQAMKFGTFLGVFTPSILTILVRNAESTEGELIE